MRYSCCSTRQTQPSRPCSSQLPMLHWLPAWGPRMPQSCPAQVFSGVHRSITQPLTTHSVHCSAARVEAWLQPPPLLPPSNNPSSIGCQTGTLEPRAQVRGWGQARQASATVAQELAESKPRWPQYHIHMMIARHDTIEPSAQIRGGVRHVKSVLMQHCWCS
jgi:hypothetical protein